MNYNIGDINKCVSYYTALYTQYKLDNKVSYTYKGGELCYNPKLST